MNAIPPPPRVRHRLLIRHPSAAAVLLVEGMDSARLPSFTSDDHHTADAEYINAAVILVPQSIRLALAALDDERP